jgi:hypothetical protein
LAQVHGEEVASGSVQQLWEGAASLSPTLYSCSRLVGAYVEAHELPESINWPKFRAAFRAHHVPQGMIKLKKKEFQDLKQGSMFVNEYITKFTQLSHYAPHEVDTDEKKQECFLNGLNDGLA